MQVEAVSCRKYGTLIILNFNNMKNLLFGLTAVGMALGFSAFTNAPESANAATRYWTNNGTNYVLYTPAGAPPVGTKCTATSSFDCAVQSEDSAIPNSFPVANPSSYDISTVPGASQARYVP